MLFLAVSLDDEETTTIIRHKSGSKSDVSAMLLEHADTIKESLAPLNELVDSAIPVMVMIRQKIKDGLGEVR